MAGTKYTITAPEGYVISEIKFINGHRSYETEVDYGINTLPLPKSNTEEVTIQLPTDENCFCLRGKVANRDFIKLTSLTITKVGGDNEGEGDEETSINEVTVENAQVIYDLTGRRVNEITESGIYIINGKKVIK